MPGTRPRMAESARRLWSGRGRCGASGGSSLIRAHRYRVQFRPMEYVFNAFVTLLVIIDPLGLAPIFAALTKGFSEKHKRESAIRGTLLGGLILYVFALAGDVLLGLWGSVFRRSGSPAGSCFSCSR